jgi:Kef-type K+ transport system membrane component KefB
MIVEQGTELIHVLISLAFLLFAAKLFAELFHKFKIPVVLGELLAGIIVGPYAIGALPIFEGKPLVCYHNYYIFIRTVFPCSTR